VIPLLGQSSLSDHAVEHFDHQSLSRFGRPFESEQQTQDGSGDLALIHTEGIGDHPLDSRRDLLQGTIAITLDTYSHVLPGIGDHTARAMHDALAPIENALTD
jgi:hypothetical protein